MPTHATRRVPRGAGGWPWPQPAASLTHQQRVRGWLSGDLPLDAEQVHAGRLLFRERAAQRLPAFSSSHYTLEARRALQAVYVWYVRSWHAALNDPWRLLGDLGDADADTFPETAPPAVAAFRQKLYDDVTRVYRTVGFPLPTLAPWATLEGPYAAALAESRARLAAARQAAEEEALLEQALEAALERSLLGIDLQDLEDEGHDEGPFARYFGWAR